MKRGQTLREPKRNGIIAESWVSLRYEAGVYFDSEPVLSLDLHYRVKRAMWVR
jgi:hypothetical protein